MLPPMTIRLATPADAASCLAIYTPIVTSTATSFEIDVPDETTFAGRMSEYGTRFPWLVAESDAGIVGYAYAGPHRERWAYQWCAEVSAYVASGRQRRGTGRALYDALLATLRHQGYVNAYAGITLPNEASVAFHAAVGFEPIGVYPMIGYKLGLWHDVVWLGMRISDPPEPPRAPKSLAECRDDIATIVASFSRT